MKAGCVPIANGRLSRSHRFDGCQQVARRVDFQLSWWIAAVGHCLNLTFRYCFLFGNSCCPRRFRVGGVARGIFSCRFSGFARERLMPGVKRRRARSGLCSLCNPSFGNLRGSYGWSWAQPSTGSKQPCFIPIPGSASRLGFSSGPISDTF